MIAEEVEEGRINGYYLSISGWQKAIRRSDRDTAQRLLRNVIRISESKELQQFYRRIYTCLYEDIGYGDVDAIIEIGNRLGEQSPREVYNNPKELVEITNLMCRARKGNDLDAGKLLVVKDIEALVYLGFTKTKIKMKRAIEANDPLKFCLLGTLMFMYDRKKFWDFMPKIVAEDRIDLLRLAYRANSRGSEHGLIAALVLPFEFPTDDWGARPFKPKFYKGYPGYAIDWHTRMGRKYLLPRLAKEYGRGAKTTDFKWTVWYNEGCLRKPAVVRHEFQPKMDPKWSEMWKQSKGKRIHKFREEIMEEIYKGPEAE